MNNVTINNGLYKNEHFNREAHISAVSCTIFMCSFQSVLWSDVTSVWGKFK